MAKFRESYEDLLWEDDFFDFPNGFNEIFISKPKVEKSFMDYLKNGERLMDLAKETNLKNPLFEDLDLWDYKGWCVDEYLKNLEKKYVLPMLEKALEDTSFFDSLAKKIHPLFEFKLGRISASSESFQYRFITDVIREKHKKTDVPMYAEFKLKEGRFRVYGPAKTKLKKNWDGTCGYYTKDRTNIVPVQQISRLVAFFILLTLIMEQGSRINSLSFNEKKEDTVYNSVVAEFLDRIGATKGRGIYLYSNYPRVGKIKEFLEDNSVKYEVFETRQDYERRNSTLDMTMYSDEFFSTVLSFSDEELYQNIRFDSYLSNSNTIFPSFSRLDTSMRRYIEWMYSCCKPKAETYKKALKEYTNLSVTHARSFQTKKNIPENVIDEMQQSVLNQVFGYVEFDERTDLDKCRQFSYEFLALINELFGKIQFKDNSFRVRRLGNHRALGLYYPTVKCLCVDIASPSSAAHELGHLIDYSKGYFEPYSSCQSFQKLGQVYKQLVIDEYEKVHHGNPVKGKYGLSYYLEPTEMFARCFEIYLVEVLKIKNSAVPDKLEGFAYPENTELLSLVEKYYSDLIATLNITANDILPEAV